MTLTGKVAHLALPRPYSTAFAAFGVVYGVPVWGFAALWAGLATALTLRTGRHQLPFGLTWWSFTFPVGTCVTGTSGLALHTRWCPGPGSDGDDSRVPHHPGLPMTMLCSASSPSAMISESTRRPVTGHRYSRYRTR